MYKVYCANTALKLFLKYKRMAFKTWKQPKCSSRDDSFKKMWYTCVYMYTHTYIYNEILLGHQKHEILPFATIWMDLENIILGEVSQTEKDKYHMISLICGL